MKNGIKFIAALSMAFAGMMGTHLTINQVAAQTMVQCGCGSASCDGGCLSRHRQKKACRKCNSSSGCVECPSCADEICKLELDRSKVKKKCFVVEQQPICVPPVRLPWAKCPPATSKTKLVKVLSTKSYECPNCAYKWKLVECELPEEASSEADPKAAPKAAPTPATPEKAAGVPAPPIYEVRRPNQRMPWQPTVTSGNRGQVVASGDR